MTSPTQKGEREEALERAARFLEQIASPSDDSREIAAQCRSALLSSSKAEGEMREDLETQKEQAAWRESGRRRVIDEIAKKMDLYDPRVGDMIRALEDQT